MSACEEKCGVRCTCRELNAANKRPGVIIVCDDCVLWEIRRLDAAANDGRTGYVCDTCGSPSWEPQGSTTCCECVDARRGEEGE